MAAWLASAGPTHVAAVGAETAAALHDFAGYPRSGRPVLITPRAGSARNPLAVMITATDLRASDCTTFHTTGLLVTTAARTVVDLALTESSRARVERLLDRSLHDRRTTVPELWEILLYVADRGKKGVPRLRHALSERLGHFVPAQSELEHRAIEALIAAGLDPPQRQHPLPGPAVGKVDLAYPEARLLVELDGSTHLLPSVRRSDYERDVAAARDGWLVLRFDWSHVVYRTGWFAASVVEVRRDRLRIGEAAA